MRKSVWLLSAGLVALSTPGFAQTAGTTTPSPQTGGEATAQAASVDQPITQGEIVVTATRRNQALSDVPIAVSAVTGDQLKNSGASDIRQLNQVSPSLLVSSTSSEASGAVARIRGVGTVGDNPGLESSVALFIDGVYRSRTGVGLTELGAIDRIEVLRGPQGTLFGRNASAGLISIITQKPKFENSVEGEATLGNYDYRRFGAGINGMISDSLAARLDAIFVKRDGFIEDQISGRSVNNRDRWMLRGQLLYQPSTDFSVRLIADYTKRNEECCGAVYEHAQDYTIAGPQPSTVKQILTGLGATIIDDPKRRDMTITPGRDYNSDVKDAGLSGEINYNLGGVKMTSITAYRYNDAVRGQDADFNNLDLLYRKSDGGYGTRYKTFTQEVRFNGTTLGGKLDWLVGGYYANEKLRQVDNFSYGADYTAYSNCLTAYKVGYALYNAGFQGQDAAHPSGAALPSIGGNGCINTAQAGALFGALGGAANSTARAIALLSGLNPSTAGYYGYGAVARALQLSLGLPAAPSLAGVGLNDLYNQNSNNWALFTHNIFSITDQLKLTVGARYTHEKKTLNADLIDNNYFCSALYAAGTSGVPSVAALAALETLPCAIPSVPGNHFTGKESKTEGKLSGTVNLSYKPVDDLLLYASYSRGYKAGGFNLDRSAFPRLVFPTSTPNDPGVGAVCGPQGATPAPGCAGGAATLHDLEFKPEINDAFELGAKYNGRGLDINVAIFHQLFRDFQLNAFNGTNFIVENINSCSEDLHGTDADASPTTGACSGKVRAGVKSQGVELEVFSRPLPDVSLNGGLTYAETTYRKNLVGADGRALSPNFFQLPGRQISNAAKITATASAAWTPRIGGSGLRGLVYVDWRHTGKLNTGSDLDIEKTQRAFDVFNARVGISGPNHAWSVELWAQNVFDKLYDQVDFDMPLQGYGTLLYSNTQRGVDTGRYPRANQLFGSFQGEPRTIGITVRGRWAPAPRIVEAAPPPVLPPPPAPASQTCADGTVIDATATCPVPPPPPPPPAAGERG